MHAKLQQLVEEAEITSKNKHLDALSAATIVDTLTNEMYAVFESTREEVREQCKPALLQPLNTWDPTNVTSLAPIRLAKHFLDLKIHSIALTESISSTATSLNSNDVQDWRHKKLMQCLQSCKAFFETFLSLPISEYRNMAFAEKGRIVLTLTILSKLCFDISGCPRWNSAWARKEVQFGMIIESLCYRTQELTSTGKSRNPNETALPPDYFFMVKSVLQILKEAYDEAVAEALKTSEEERKKRKQGPRCPALNGGLMRTDFWEALEYSHGFGVDPLLDGNWNLNDSSSWNWDWKTTI